MDSRHSGSIKGDMLMVYKNIDHFAQAAPADTAIVYHVGHSLYRPKGGYTAQTHKIRELYNMGLVRLFQRRLSSGQASQFEYIAVKNKRRTPPVAAYSCDTGQPVHLFPGRV